MSAAIVAAYEHGLVFTKEDIARLIATNRDFMWNQQIKGAKFQRIDGEKADPRWANSPGLLWTPLAPYDPTLRKIFEANHNPGGWGGLTATPQWVARFGRNVRSRSVSGLARIPLRKASCAQRQPFASWPFSASPPDARERIMRPRRPGNSRRVQDMRDLAGHEPAPLDLRRLYPAQNGEVAPPSGFAGDVSDQTSAPIMQR